MAIEFLNGIKIPAGEINLKGITIERASGSGADGFDNDALGSYILSPTDGSWGAGTKPAGSHNGVGILSFQTHSDNYYTQLALSTSTNDLFIRSADGTTTFGSYNRLWNDSHFSTTNVTNWNTAYTHSQATHAPTDAEKNVQANWSESSTSSDAFIKNKPTIPTNHTTLPTTTSDTFDFLQDNSAVSLHQFNNTLTDVGGNYNATSTGASFGTALDTKFGSHGINTQGDGTYVDIAGLPAIQAVSIWYKAIGNDNGYIVDFRHDTPNNGRSYLYTQAGSDQSINWGNDTTTSGQTGDIWINGVAFTSGQYNFTSGNWYHIVITTNTNSTKQKWDQGIRIGNRSDGTSNGNAGYFDQVRTFNRRLTSADVALLYSEVETGATADQTAGEILSLIKTVDGSGTGLDADLLDGQQGSHYLNYNNLTNKPTIPTDHGDHDGLYLPIGGGTITGDLTVNGKVTQAGVVDREEWGRTYQASNTNIATLVYISGSGGKSSPLPNGGGYRMTAHISGTGTDQVSVAVFWNENGKWFCNNTFASGTNSNHIEFLISGDVPKIKTWHSNDYTINVTHERLSLDEGTGTDNLRGFFGSDSYLKWTESTNALVVPGTIVATNLSGTNTGDQDLSGYSTTDTIFNGGDIDNPVIIANRSATSILHYSASGNTTGAIKITLPGKHSNGWSMLVLRITVYEYNSTTHTTFTVSGHDWTSGWYNKSVKKWGDSTKNIGFGYSTSADTDCIIIGEVKSGWSYGHVTVDVISHPSFYSSSMNLDAGWKIEKVTSLSGITRQAVTNEKVHDSGDFPSSDVAKGVTAYNWGNHADAGYTGDQNLSGYKPINGQSPIDINTGYSARTGTWTESTSESEWGAPNITGGRAYNDGTGSITFDVPTGMESCWLSQLTWDSGGYMDVLGLQSDGGEIFLRRINTHQVVQNTDEGGGQHDGSTVAFAGTSLSSFGKIKFQNRSGRFHLTGITFSSSQWEGTEGTGMVHPAQITKQGSGGGLDSDKLDGQQGSHYLNYNNLTNKPTIPTAPTPANELYRETGSKTSASIGPGWITVATNQSARRHGEVIVSDQESSDHAFIRIDWLRSYADSNFTVLNVGGHSNRITGVRVLSQDSDTTYGHKHLQVYVTINSAYGVRLNTLGTPRGYTSHTAVTPVLQDTLSGFSIHGNALTGLDKSSLAAEEGITVGGDIAVGGTVDGVDISALPTTFAPTNAEQNVQANWTATSGDALILNKPTTFAPSSHNHKIILASTANEGSGGMQNWNSQETTLDLNPTTDWFTSLRIGHGDPVKYYSNTLGIQMTGSDSGRIYTRTVANGTKQSWLKYYHTGDFVNNSSNWNTAYTHSQSAHAPTNAEQNVQANWNSTSGDSLIINKPANSYFLGVTDRKVYGNLAATGNKAKRFIIGRIYYCPKHWDDTWQNLNIKLTEEHYNVGKVEYHLYAYYNGTDNQTVRCDLVNYRGNSGDISRYKIALGTHTDAGWNHSGQNVYYTDILVDVAYYKQVGVVIDTQGHSWTNVNPTSGAGHTIFYDTPVVSDITDFSDVKSNIYLGDDHKVWTSANLTNNSTNWNTAYGWGNHADAGYLKKDSDTTYNFVGTTFTSRNSGNVIGIDKAEENMVGYTNASSAAGFADGGLFVAAYSTSWVSQIFSNFRTGELSARGKKDGTWQAWRNIHDSGHFSVADVAKGVTAHGWGNHADASYLASTGKAADSDKLDGLDLHTGRNNDVNKVVRTDVNGYIQAGWINSTSGDNGTTAIGRIYASQDGYIRYYTPANFINLLGLLTTSGKAADSDKLDGLDSKQFLRSDAADTFTGTLTMGTQFALVANNYGRGMFGVYSSTRYQHVWSMGTAYKTSDDGKSAGNIYGITYTHTNVGGESKAGLSHQALFMTSGVTRTAIGTGIWTSGLITTTSYGTSSNWNTAYGWGNHASAGYLASSGKAADSDKVDGNHINYSYGVGKQYDFTVNGDANTYYPVVLDGFSGPRMTRLTIFRTYHETAPSTWNNSTHKGGLTLDMKVRVGGWGGYPNMINISDFGEIYSRICGGAYYTAHTMKFVIWLRGGGASYHLDSPNAGLSIDVNDSNKKSNAVPGTTNAWYSYDHSNAAYDVKVYSKNQTEADAGATTMLGYMPIRFDGTQNEVVGVSKALTLTAPNATNSVNSDKLDNLDSSQFIRSDAADTATKKISFTADESIGLKGARGAFTGEYIHLYNKVGVGHPSGWGYGNGDTPSQGLSTYGGANLSYGTKAESTVHGNLNLGSAADTGQRDLFLHGSAANKKSRLRTTNGNLHIDSAEGNSLYLNYYYGAATNIYFGSGNGGAVGTVSSTGLLRMANDVVAYYSFSDRRLKTDIKSTEGNLEKILSLNPVEYTWKEGPREGVKEIGLIAQEVEEIVPEVVRIQSRHDNETGDGIEYKQVDYEHLVSTLIGAMQEQQKQIDDLKSMMCMCKCKK